MATASYMFYQPQIIPTVAATTTNITNMPGSFSNRFNPSTTADKLNLNAYNNHLPSIAAQSNDTFPQRMLPPPPGLVFGNMPMMQQQPSVAPQILPQPVHPSSFFNSQPYFSQQPVVVPPAPIVNHPQQQEEINGGVSQYLDYDLQTMSEYIVNYTNIAFDSISTMNDETTDLFTKGVSSVLNATRLPSATIYLALDYLSKYINKLTNGIASIGGNSVNVIYQNTMIALILANKFNDDKTFTNRSWSDATGIQLNFINDYEKNWLKTFNWKLYDDKFIAYNDYVKNYEFFTYGKQRNQTISPLSSLTLTPASSHCEKFSNNNINNNSSVQNGYETPVNVPSYIYPSPNYQTSHYYTTTKNNCINNNPTNSLIDYSPSFNNFHHRQQSAFQQCMPPLYTTTHHQPTMSLPSLNYWNIDPGYNNKVEKLRYPIGKKNSYLNFNSIY